MVSRGIKIARWWKRGGITLRVTVFFLAIASLSLLLYLQRSPDDSERYGSNLLVVIFVNLNVLLLCVLAFLIGRNVVKLIFDRRKNILGSRLKLRLVVAFVGLTLIPTTILFVLASGLIHKAFEGWFSSQVEASVGGAVKVARQHYTFLREVSRDAATRIGKELQSKGNLINQPEQLYKFLEERRKDEELFGVSIIDQNGQVLSETHNAAAVIESFSAPPPDKEAVEKALKEESGVLYEEKEASQFVRVYLPLRIAGKKGVLLATRRIDSELSAALASVNESFREYRELKVFKNPLKSGYILTLALLTALILFSAIWIGFYMAREIAIPIQRLAEGMTHVAKGHYGFQVRVGGDDEIGFLVRSFNRMTADLKTSRLEGDRRRRYIETILSNLAVGVIGLDTSRGVTSVNQAARRIFGLDERKPRFGIGIAELLKPQDFENIRSLLDELEAVQEGEQKEALEKQIQVSSQGRELKVVCTAGQIVGEDKEWLGTVLLVDDITELSKAQHMSVWREVAQRIAHEIKNPLTPIQLSAQRLERMFAADRFQGEDLQSKVEDCTQTIVHHVDSIKRLANEFSNFARMPTAEFTLANLNTLIADTVAPFAEQHGKVVFQFIAENRLPEIFMDREQIRRVLINLIDNAIAALKTPNDNLTGREESRIVIRTKYDRKRKMVSFEVSDNGPGVHATEKPRVFEPYFTTKREGSGLGLAIVTSIVSDHKGEIALYDNVPSGAKFIVTLPITQQVTTQRRFEAA